MNERADTGKEQNALEKSRYENECHDANHMKIVGENDLPIGHRTVILIGKFDGVHIGHERLIEEMHLLCKKLDASSLVWTFSESPLKFVNVKNLAKVLTDNKEKSDIFESHGVNLMFFADFVQYRNLPPEEFAHMLCERFGAVGVVCGYNFLFGKNRSGNAELLKKLLAEYKAECVIVPPIYCERNDVEMVVSSTGIREAISNGDMELASLMLGRSYGFSAPVIHGEHRGSTLGTPTANQQFPADRVIPPHGVYVSCCVVDGICYEAITNLGIHPTFNVVRGYVQSETHIFGYNGDLYGKTVEVRFLRMIRNEEKFSSTEELKRAVANDLAEAKRYFDSI